MEFSKSFFRSLVLLFVCAQTIVADALPSAQSMQSYVDAVVSFSEDLPIFLTDSAIKTTDASLAQKFAAVNAIFYFYEQKDNLQTTLVDEKKIALVDALKMIKFNPMVSLQKDAQGMLTGSLGAKIEDLISKLNTEFVQDNSFFGNKQKLKATISAYKNLSAEDISSLVAGRKVFGFEEVFPSGNQSTSILKSLVNNRMQESLTEFITDSQVEVDITTSPSKWESAQYSFKDLKQLFAQVKSALVSFVPPNKAEAFSSFCNAQIDALSQPISFDERVLALRNKVDEEASLKKEVFEELLKRIILSLNISVDQSKRRRVVDIIDLYISKSSLSLSRTDFSTQINLLNQAALGFEYFKEGEVVFFQLGNGSSSGKKTYMSMVKKDGDWTIVEDSNLTNAIFFKVFISQNMPIFQTSITNSSGVSEKFVLQTDLSGQLTLVLDNANYASNQTPVASAREEYLFSPYSSSGSKDKLSLKSFKTGGYIVCSLDKKFRTKSPVSDTPFLLEVGGDGALIQASNNTFSVKAAPDFILNLSQLNKSAFVPDALTGKFIFSGSSQLNSATSYLQEAMRIIQALSAQVDPVYLGIIVSSLDTFLSATYESQEVFSDLQSTSKASRQSLDIIVDAIQRMVSSSSDDLLTKSLATLLSKYNYILTTKFTAPLTDALKKVLPKDEDLIALRMKGSIQGSSFYPVAQTETDTFLIGKKTLGLGEVNYTISLASGSNPLNQDAQFIVKNVKTMFGFQPSLINGLFLTIRPDIVKSIVENPNKSTAVENSKTFNYEQPSFDQSGGMLPFEDASNQGSQFYFIEQKDASGATLGFKIKVSLLDRSSSALQTGISIPVVRYLSRDTATGELTLVDESGSALIFDIFAVSDFFKILSYLGSSNDLQFVIQGFSDALDSVKVDDEIRLCLVQIKSFLEKQNSSVDSWTSFLGQAPVVAMFKKLVLKLDDILKIKYSSTTNKNLLASIKALFDSGAKVSLDMFVDGDSFAIKVLDNAKSSLYLKAKPATAVSNQSAQTQNAYINFSADSYADPVSEICLDKNLDGSVRLYFKGLRANDSSNAYISLKSDVISISNKDAAASFKLEGTFDSLSLREVSTSKFLGLKNKNLAVELYSGVMDNDGRSKPLPGQQVFSLERLSAQAKLLVAARKACDLKDHVWADNGRLVSSKSDDFIKAVRARLTLYSQFAANASSYSLSDKKEFFSEVEKFVTGLTTALNGDVYAIVLSDPASKELLESSVVDAMTVIAQSEDSLVAAQRRIKNIWEEGYLAPGVLNRDNIVSISVVLDDGKAYYLGLSQSLVSGQQKYVIKPYDSKYYPETQFKVFTYKDRVALRPQFAVDSVVSFDYKKTPASFSVGVDKIDVASLDFSLAENLKYQLLIDYDASGKSFLRYFVINNNAIEEHTIALDNNLKVLTDELFQTGSVKKLFTPVKLDLLDLKISQAVSETLEKSIDILTEVITMNYLDASPAGSDGLTKADRFVSGVSLVFDNAKKDSALWNRVLSADSFKASLARFLQAVISVPDDILSKALKTNIALITGKDDFVDLASFKNAAVVLGWQDSLGNNYFLGQNSGDVKFDGNVRLSAGHLFYMDVVELGLGARVKLFTLDDQGNSLYLAAQGNVDGKSEEAGVGLVADASKALVLKPFGSATQFGLRAYNSGTEGGLSNLYLGFSDVSDKVVSLIMGDLNQQGQYAPSLQQMFALQKLSDVEAALAMSNNDDISSQLASFVVLINKVLQDFSDDSFKILLQEIKSTVMRITSTKSLYASVANVPKNSNLIGSIIKTLQGAVKNRASYRNLVQSIADIYAEGYVGSPDKDLPKDGALVALFSGLKYLGAYPQLINGANVFYAANPFLSLADERTFLKVSVYKDKFGFSFTNKDGSFYLKATSTPTVVTPASNNIAAVTKNLLTSDQDSLLSYLVFEPLPKDDSGVDISFGSPATRDFQFTLSKTSSSPLTVSVSIPFQAPGAFNLSFDANSYLRVVPGASATPLSLSIRTLGPVYSRMMQAIKRETELAVVQDFQKIINENFVQTTDDARFFVTVLEAYLQARVSSVEAWKKMTETKDVLDGYKKLVQGLLVAPVVNRKLLFDGLLTNVISILAKGFYLSFRDGDVVCLKKVMGQDVRFLSGIKNSANSYQLQSVAQDQVSALSLFKIKNVTDGDKQYVQLVVGINGEDFVVSVNDKDAAGIPASLVKKTSLTSAAQLATYFEVQGDLGQLSFKSVATTGFLSLASDKKLYTKNPVSRELTGVLSSGVRYPGQQEQFVADLLAPHDQALVYLSNPLSSSDVSSYVNQLIQYPNIYQADNSTELARDPVYSKKYIDAVKSFVNKVTANKDLFSSVSQDIDQAVYALVQSLVGYAGQGVDKQVVEEISQNWINGYKEASELNLPAHGSSFVMAVDYASAGSLDFFDSELKFVKLYQQAGASSSMISSLGKDFLSGYFVDQDAMDESFILNNDPFAESCLFKMNMIRKGISICPKSDASKFCVIPDIAISTSSFSQIEWDKARASFIKPDLSTDYPAGMMLIPTEKDGVFKLQCKLTKAAGFVHFDSLDGFARLFRRKSADDGGNPEVATGDAKLPSIVMIEAKEFYNQVVAARGDRSDNQPNLYAQAIKMISTSIEANMMAAELARVVINKKQNQKSWDAFFANKSGLQALLDLLKGFYAQFSTATSSIRISDFNKAVLERMILLLSGKMAPNFAIVDEKELVVLSFAQSFKNLQINLSSLSEELVPKFLNDVKELFARRCELDFTESSDDFSENGSFIDSDVVPWLSGEVMENEVIAAKEDAKSELADLATKFNTPLKFKEGVDNLAQMLKIKTFSQARADLFVVQAMKAVDPDKIKNALAEGQPVSVLQNIVKRAMNSQLKPFLEKMATGVMLPAWMSLGSNTKKLYKNILDKVVKLCVFPISNSQNLVDLVTQQAALLIKNDFDENIISVIADLLQNWDYYAGSRLTAAQAKLVFKASSSDSAALKVARIFYLERLITAVKPLYNKVKLQPDTLSAGQKLAGAKIVSIVDAMRKYLAPLSPSSQALSNSSSVAASVTKDAGFGELVAADSAQGASQVQASATNQNPQVNDAQGFLGVTQSGL